MTNNVLLNLHFTNKPTHSNINIASRLSLTPLIMINTPCINDLLPEWTKI